MHHDQFGFIPGMQDWFNICKAKGVVQHMNRLRMIISINEEKAFDRVQHLFVIKIPEEMSSFMLLYHKPRANILLNKEQLSVSSKI